MEKADRQRNISNMKNFNSIENVVHIWGRVFGGDN